MLCPAERQNPGEAAFAHPLRYELPHDWPDADPREVEGAVLVGLARMLHHSENVIRRPNERCPACRIIARLPDDIRAYLDADRLRSQ